MDIPIDTTTITIETERLLLRPFAETDLADFNAYASVPGVGEMAGWQHHKTMEESKQVLQMFLEEKENFALVHKADGKVIGSLGLHYSWANVDERYRNLRAVEIGFVLAKDYWGQGLAPEAVKSVIAYGFDKLGVEVFTCSHFVENSQSKRVIEKCGFQFVRRMASYASLLERRVEEMQYVLLRG